MKESVSFSGKEIESVSLNFTELRKKGLEYIQELSGDVWTDYNSHDPGVTILEQLCYSLTDIAYRTSLPVKDLLTTGNEIPPDIKKNAFLTPSSILSSHPVTLKDTRKMIFDRFEEILNVWIVTKEGKGYEEQLNGINKIEILPKPNFLKSISDPNKKDNFLKEVNNFLHENRNIGEYYNDALLLEPQAIDIEFNIYVNEQVDLEKTIAGLFLKLLEFVYCPIQYNSFDEMKEAGYSMEETFSGPKLNRGFIRDDNLKNRLKSIPSKESVKDDISKNRLKSIHIDELQKLLSKVDGIFTCVVKPFNINGVKEDQIEVDKDKFFHLLEDENSRNFIDNRFDRIYKNMTVFVNNIELPIYNKQKINNLFSEAWSKKHRGYPIGNSLKELSNNNFRNPKEYYSVQRHFPIIYGIGEEGLSKNEPEERKVKALQLKAYLMLFEQHMANHLAQLGNLSEFFNVDFENGQEKTYFTQWMNSIPDIDKLANENIPKIESYLESKHIFFNRKNRIYNHLLARFGEDLSDIPWKISHRLNMIPNEDEYNRILLLKKSQFLMNIEKLSYYRARGECFLPDEPYAENPKYIWTPSGLEDMILAKTGISAGGSKSIIPDFTESNLQIQKLKKVHPLKETEELTTKYRYLSQDEIKNSDQTGTTNIPKAVFEVIGIKELFKETLDYKNYRISRLPSQTGSVQVIFQKERNVWINLFKCSTEQKAIQIICQIMDYFIKENQKSEGIFIVDHILLSDILIDSKYGFKFIDYGDDDEFGDREDIDNEGDEVDDDEDDVDDDQDKNNFDKNNSYPFQIQTIDDESWCDSEEERNNRINQFYVFGKENNSYHLENENLQIKDDHGKTIATCIQDNINPNNDVVFSEMQKKVKSIIQLFNETKGTNGRLRFKELEKIRLKGSINQKPNNNEQRRLVFQRKINWEGKEVIIDEDFFNLNVTVLLPDWPARFQIDRFKAYVTDIIHERIPAHISNEILWVDAYKLSTFNKKYLHWQKLRLESKNSNVLSTKIEPAEIKSAAYEVYQELMELKKN